MPNVVPISFSLATAAAWGASNFLGGYAGRRANPFLIATVANFAGLLFLLVVTVASHAPFPSVPVSIWSLLAGVSGGLGLAIYYEALASGRMGLAAPVVGVVSVGIPTLLTLMREGSPGSLRLIGFGLAIFGVSMIGRKEEKTEKKLLAMAIVAGCGFAGYSLAIKQAGPGSPLWIEMHSRTAALLITAAVALILRKGRAFPAGAGWLATAAGLLDVAGSVAFVRAAQTGRLDMAVVIASLYPAVTVLLAWNFLEERLSMWKAVGVCAALLALPLITYG